MKHCLLFLALLASCSADTTPDSAEVTNSEAVSVNSSCPQISDPITAAAGKQHRIYHTIPGFDPKKKECWEMLREAAKQEGKSTDGATIIAYIDAKEFTPGQDGMYDNDEKRQQQIVAQVLVNNSLDLYEFTPDPLGSGKYTEPSK